MMLYIASLLHFYHTTTFSTSLPVWNNQRNEVGHLSTKEEIPRRVFLARVWNNATAIWVYLVIVLKSRKSSSPLFSVVSQDVTTPTTRLLLKNPDKTYHLLVWNLDMILSETPASFYKDTTLIISIHLEKEKLFNETGFCILTSPHCISHSQHDIYLERKLCSSTHVWNDVFLSSVWLSATLAP